ncbi:hypothetical protein PIIN_06044 [Serendipita indica DSM 11827]|uniref:F-box domain-containing protein n=1 Tax=Serendipita indica (strain DSM 11827) TaxID=1109443 RepID=G4TLB5_SERID|nr:hypothetical protein PIIN_06044 [Serendipita indica DSM 11827]
MTSEGVKCVGSEWSIGLTPTSSECLRRRLPEASYSQLLYTGMNKNLPPNLPYDILRQIFEHLGRADLYALSLVCTTFLHPASEVLYQYILPPSSTTQFIRLFWTLSKAPLVARSVHTLHLAARGLRVVHLASTNNLDTLLKAQPSATFSSTDVVTPNGASDRHQGVRNPQEEDGFGSLERVFDEAQFSNMLPLVVVERAFYNLSSLQELVIHPHIPFLFWSFTRQMPSLRHVRVLGRADSTLLLFWLAKQTNLVSLHYEPSDHYVTQWFPSGGPESEGHFVSNLKTLRTNVRGAILLAPQRPIVNLRLEFGDVVEVKLDGKVYRRGQYSPTTAAPNSWSLHELGESLRKTRVPINSFTLGDCCTTHYAPLLIMVSRYLSQITHLSLAVEYEYSTLPLLPHLLTLEVPTTDLFHLMEAVRGKSNESNSEVSEEWRGVQSNKVLKWSKASRSLRLVIFHPSSPLIESKLRSLVKYRNSPHTNWITERSFIHKWPVSRP